MEETTQRNEVLRILKAGYKISGMTALAWIGCYRLSARIWELRRMGYNIAMEYASRPGKRYAEYHLVKKGGA